MGSTFEVLTLTLLPGKGQLVGAGKYACIQAVSQSFKIHYSAREVKIPPDILWNMFKNIAQVDSTCF